MESKQTDNNLRKFTKQLQLSSQRLFSSFIDDGDQKKLKENKIKSDIQFAITNQKMVVLQLKPTEHSALSENVVGTIYPRNIQNDTIMIKEPKNDQLRMVPYQQIKRVRVLDYHPLDRKKTAE